MHECDTPPRGVGLEHYENEDAWGDHYWDPIQADRARQTAALVPTSAVGILDVGCGAGILTRELRSAGKTVVGLDFAEAPLRQVPPPRVRADATSLPFSTATFDLVLATELLEHLPQPARRLAFAEMTRVTRAWVLVCVPYREALASRAICCQECGCVFHMYRHMASFDERAMRGLLSPAFNLIETRVMGPRIRYGPTVLTRLGQVGGGYSNPGRFAICPMCGNRDGFVHRRNLLTRLLTGLPARVGPKLKGSWLAALYERI